MIINMAEAFCPSIQAIRSEIDELDTKATPKTPLTVATNAAQFGFDFDGV
jgi:hypothetical protein